MGAKSIARARYYLGGTFVVEHRPRDGRGRATAILLLPPMGYEDTCAYRPLRVLADALASAGHVVLRLDWPMLGDGPQTGEEGDVVARCVGVVQAASASLRARGFRRVGTIGLRAGGLIALAAGGSDDVVLWALPAGGKAYLREERAFHKMAARAYGDPPADRVALPTGGVEAGGFVYSAATVAALEQLVAVDLAAARAADVCTGLVAELTGATAIRRVLLLEREGSASPAPLIDVLTGGGAVVRVSPAAGLGDLLENPYQAKLDPGVEETITAWFASAPATAAGPADIPAHTAAPGGQPTLFLPDGVTERPWVERGGAGELGGIVCEPPGGATPGAVWTVFFNAGGIRRSGPNRLWTRAARALAAAGRPSLRFDVRDVGDSDGASIPHADLEAMYSESSIDDALVAWEWARAQEAGAIDVVGLCSGAFMGAQVSARRDVRRALLFNGLAWVWNDDARASGMTSHIRGSLFDARRWRRLMTGRIDAVALARAVVSKAQLTVRATVAQLAGQPPPDAVAALLAAVMARGTHLHLVASEGDPSIAYLDAHVTPDTRPQLTILRGVDHTIRPVWAHSRVIELIIGTESPILGAG